MSSHQSPRFEESSPAGSIVPLSERPLVADSENTVINAPEQPRPVTDVSRDATLPSEELSRRLFPPAGASGGEEAGIRLAHYEIVRRLGSGGMGAVFLATDQELNREVALKILHPASAQDASLVARFRNEARACALLNHDNIARVFYAGSEGGLYFIAYEFASGQTLREVIELRGQLTPAETVNCAIQTTLALIHLAAAGIVHRDIKPSNIMLTRSGRVKVVDLGLARRDSTDSIGDITVAGTTLGTFDYIAPEQARDPREADIRSDLYSLGCTMYHMLTGQPPYPEGTALQKLLDHQGKSAPDPRAINPRVPEELAAIVRRLMDSNPDQRYPDPGLLLEDLMRMAALMGLRSVPAEGIVWRRADRPAQRGPGGAIWVLISVILICVTALILDRTARTSRPDDELLAGDDASWQQVDPSQFPSQEPTATTAGGPAVPSTATTGNGPGQAVSVTGTSDPASLAPSSAAGAGDRLTPAASEVLASQSAIILPNAGPLLPSWLSLSFSPRLPAGGPPPIVEPEGPFVLQSAGGGSRSFRTLKAAVADARSGDLILLRYNGFPDTLPAQPPIRVNGMNLIIRAAEGFRPTLEFDGRQAGTVQPGQMISLRGNGSLSLRDVDLRLIARSDSTTDRWSLFHCVGAGRLSLENVSLELLNPDRQPASLFDLTDDASSSPPTGIRDLTELSLTRVVARADGDAFRIAAQPRARLQILNSGFALLGTLASIPGDSSMQLARGTIELSLDHVTCLHGGPLISMRDSDDRTARVVQRLLPSLAVRSEACVFAVAGGDRQLLLSRGNSYLEDMERLVSWTGSTNLYDGHAVFWFFESSAVDFASRRLDFLQWRQLWSQRSDSEETRAAILPSLAWKNPGWRSQTASMTGPQFTRAAFELDPALFVPDARSLPLARDGRIPGVNPAELPEFPVRPDSPPAAGESAPNAGIPVPPETASATKSGNSLGTGGSTAASGTSVVSQPAASLSGPNR